MGNELAFIAVAIIALSVILNAIQYSDWSKTNANLNDAYEKLDEKAKTIGALLDKDDRNLRIRLDLSQQLTRKNDEIAGLKRRLDQISDQAKYEPKQSSFSDVVAQICGPDWTSYDDPPPKPDTKQHPPLRMLDLGPNVEYRSGPAPITEKALFELGFAMTCKSEGRHAFERKLSDSLSLTVVLYPPSKTVHVLPGPPEVHAHRLGNSTICRLGMPLEELKYLVEIHQR